MRIGTAGWAIAAANAAALPGDGSHLERYAARMNCVEINSSFHRSHRVRTYARWADGTPEDFRFAVKLPKHITHACRLEDAGEPLAQFVAEAFDGAVVCEPRHRSWFTPQADELLARCEVARAAADPAKWSQSDEPGGWAGPSTTRRPAVFYFRWHGSPRTYWSSYDEAWLRERAQALARLPAHTERWCIFDNTAAGAALPNALQLKTLSTP